MPETDTDLLIAGAGPTGLMLANQLARRGVRVELIDRHSGPAQQSRAIGVQARTLEIYDRLGVVPQAMALGFRASAANLWDRTGITRPPGRRRVFPKCALTCCVPTVTSPAPQRASTQRRSRGGSTRRGSAANPRGFTDRTEASTARCHATPGRSTDVSTKKAPAVSRRGLRFDFASDDAMNRQPFRVTYPCRPYRPCHRHPASDDHALRPSAPRRSSLRSSGAGRPPTLH